MYNGKLIDLILVPSADAGQTGREIRCVIKNNTDYIFYNTYIYNRHEEKSKRSIKVDVLIYVVDYKVNKFFNDLNNKGKFYQVFSTLKSKKLQAGFVPQ